MGGNFFRENQWWVSPYNFSPEVRAQFGREYDLAGCFAKRGLRWGHNHQPQ